MHIIQSVPTNIITGFLGVGKTTAINHILKSKPDGERWAVLVNEFGEVGVDASLISGNHADDNGVFIKEVSGGCMCCTSGLPMQIALNRLLSEAKPHRLIIEPTGLGHPTEVLQALNQPHYKQVIQLQATITLVDARNLKDARYTHNDTFNEQLVVADVIVGNKADLYTSEDKEALKNYIGKFSTDVLHLVEHAELDWQWLQQPNEYVNSRSAEAYVAGIGSVLAQPNQSEEKALSEQPLPDCGYVKVKNTQDDYQSIGWRFTPAFSFDRTKLSVFMMGLDVMRAKAVFKTQEGIFGYNKTPTGMTEISLDDCMDSRIEIINTEIKDEHSQAWESELLSARVIK